MTDKLYKARNGTEHIVRVIGKYREMLRGETIDNTAWTYQVLAQRQVKTIDEITHPNLKKQWSVSLWYDDDTDFDPFTMEYELFMENYESIDDI